MQPVRNCEHERGQASILGIALIGLAVMLASTFVCVAQWSIARGELQQAADVAAAQLVKFDLDAPQPAARAAALSNGASTVRFGADSHGQYVHVTATAPAMVRTVGVHTISARAYVHEIAALLSQGASTSSVLGAGIGARGVALSHEYSGRLVQVDAARLCPAVATSYLSMQRVAALQGVRLWAVSGYRSYAEQARLYAQLGPRIAAPPGRSLHHAATELDIAVGSTGSPTHRWLTTRGSDFGFIQRYSWEPWHWGNVRGC